MSSTSNKVGFSPFAKGRSVFPAGESSGQSVSRAARRLVVRSDGMAGQHGLS